MSSLPQNEIQQPDYEGAQLSPKTSTDSVPSVIFGWKHSTQRVRMPVSEGPIGTVQKVEFFLCLTCVLLLSVGLSMSCISIWGITHRISYSHLIDGTVYMGISSFGLCAGLLCLPAGFVAFFLHRDEKYYVYLPLLIVLLDFITILLSIECGFAFIQKSRIQVDYSKKTPKLIPTYYSNVLNDTLVSNMYNLKSNPENLKAWDALQIKIKCCGSAEWKQWMLTVEYVPVSCCENEICQEYFKKGCLESLAFDLLSELTFLTGVSLVAIAIVFSCGSVLTTMYCVQRTKYNIKN